MVTLHLASLLEPSIFPIASAHFASLLRFGSSYRISNGFILVVFVVVICDQWTLSLLGLTDVVDNGQHFLAKTLF